MKQQYLRLYAFIFGLAFIISGVIFTFTKMYKDDREKKVEEEKVIADEIGDIYKTFFEKENEVNAYRDTLLKDFGDYVTFYANMPKKYDKMAEKIKNMKL